MKPVRLFLLAPLGLIATLRFASPLTATVVLGHSMEPTIHPGAVTMLNRGYYSNHPLRRGDVVVLRYEGDTYIKRIYALPGDQLQLVRYREGGSDELVDPITARRLRKAHAAGRIPDRQLSTLTIPPGYCYVLGDNSNMSVDSRDFGPVPIATIEGHTDF
jgi:signal peptidase I